MADQSYYTQQQGQYQLIPGAGTYLQNQAQSQSAYERAKAQLMAQRSQKQISSGLGKDYSVDPNAQYGTYQQMLQGQGQELNQANEQSQQRGFFGPGLGNQAESAMRYGQAVQNLGFKNSLADYESQYQSGMGDLERQKNSDMLGALQGAADYGVNNEDYTPYDPTNDPSNTPPPGAPPRPSSKPVGKPKPVPRRVQQQRLARNERLRAKAGRAT